MLSFDTIMALEQVHVRIHISQFINTDQLTAINKDARFGDKHFYIAKPQHL